MTRNEKRDILGEINFQAASVLNTFYEPATPMVDSSGNDVVPHDLEEIKNAKVVLGLTKLRKMVAKAIVDISESGGGR